MSSPEITPQKAFAYLLSRADTLHDFVGSRSILSKSEVLQVINESGSELSDKMLEPLLKEVEDNMGEKTDPNNIKYLLNKNESAPLVNVSLPATYTPKMIKRIGDIVSYEPKVVLFYELHEEFLNKNTTNPVLNIGRYVSNDNLIGFTFEDKNGKYRIGESICSAEDFTSATIAYLNLGTTEKNDANGEIIRNKSGLYNIISKEERYQEWEAKIKEFFGVVPDQRVYLVVDVCGVKLHELGVTDTTPITPICNVAGEWDGAQKSTCAPANISCMDIEDSGEDLERAVFGLRNISLKKDANESKVVLTTEGTTSTMEKNLSTNPVVEVTPLSQCIKDMLDSKGKKCKKGKSQGKCYEGLSPFDLFDIKRTGDAFQALMTKKMITTSNNTWFCYDTPRDEKHNFIFVTVDHLAFLKARMNGISSIFTAKDGTTEAKLMIMYKPEVDATAYLKQYAATYFNLQKVKEAMDALKLDHVLDAIAVSHHGQESIDQDLSLKALSEERNQHYQNFKVTMTTLKTFYSNLIDQKKFDHFFITNLENVTTRADKAITDVLQKMTSSVASNFLAEDRGTNHYKNVQKIVDWLPSTIYKMMNSILYIEIIAQIHELYKQFTWKVNADGTGDIGWVFESGFDYFEIEDLLKTTNLSTTDLVKELSNNRNMPQDQVKGNHEQLEFTTIISKYVELKEKRENINRTTSEMTHYCRKYDYLLKAKSTNDVTSNLVVVETEDYINIFKRITDIINAGIYGKKVGTQESLYGIIEKLKLSSTTSTTSRQMRALALEASNRLVTIMAKLLDTLTSFAAVKLKSITVRKHDTTNNALDAVIKMLQTEVETINHAQTGGTPEDVDIPAPIVDASYISLKSVINSHILVNDDEATDGGPFYDAYIDLLKQKKSTMQEAVPIDVTDDDVIKEVTLTNPMAFNDPYDYGQYIYKFEPYIIDAIFGDSSPLTEDQKNDFKTVLGTNQESPELEYFVHWYMEYYMRKFWYLHPGLAAFYMVPDPTAPTSKQPSCTLEYMSPVGSQNTHAPNLKRRRFENATIECENTEESRDEKKSRRFQNVWEWDDMLCYYCVLDPLYMFKLNTYLIENSHSSETKTVEPVVEFTIKNKPETDTIVSTDEKMIEILRCFAAKEQCNIVCSEAAGGASPRTKQKPPMAYYFKKYYKPYYDLYYK